MNERVMLVDDEDCIRESMEIYFRAKGMKIVTASSGDECLRRLEAGFRGVILMDIMMPRMDGWDTIQEILKRSLYDGNVIVMLTAMMEPDSKMDGLQEYVIDYVTKPFNPENLLDSVRHYETLLQAKPRPASNF